MNSDGHGEYKNSECDVEYNSEWDGDKDDEDDKDDDDDDDDDDDVDYEYDYKVSYMMTIKKMMIKKDRYDNTNTGIK